MNLRVEVSGPVDLLEVHRRDPKTFPYLLESAAAHPQAGRYDILFGFPGERLSGEAGFREMSSAFMDLEKEPRNDLPFVGGWFLLLGYESARWIEPSLRLPKSPFLLPDFLAVRCSGAIINDRERGVTVLVSEGSHELINYMKNIIHVDDSYAKQLEEKLVDRIVEDDDAPFLDGVERIHRYLLAGDIFQVNLSRAWRADLRRDRSYLDVYQRLRRHNPSPFAGLAVEDGVAVLSSSPERLVQSENGWVQTRPIAGTRPRVAGEDDAAMRAQLIGSLKERAEHVMLIDLERNDLGRVCEPGSIEVSELMALESYAHVHHIVSNVRGRLRADVTSGDILRAVFPGGTITGCPKVRAMEIIAELEGVGRGPYTGAMGYLSRSGRLDTNILIRSLVVQDRQVSFRAGAGIVADSQPRAELAETRAKARGMLLALGEGH
ncbi:anthranilate synthase component 1 [Panacagrimonas perspica]|uniref:Anthranilate synthase component 1 n=1 Tax=Panacagrimonas perspica TaxID=381431 RepID=A0A4S3K540_9GAMM|nr:aminodeoxychorismate synthase component I [Panacagrimonas perspica]TDU31596.1 anthranilate synthase component 1 [Panacagrimonas perspica]THD03176.1 aminodeoxychorismate synthase, component I [Panacagrimonas perspica]